MKITADVSRRGKGLYKVNQDRLRTMLASEARTLVKLIRSKHKIGMNIGDVMMNTLGPGEDGGYSNAYESWKQRYLTPGGGTLSRKYNLLVDLELSGRFHRGLRISYGGYTKNKGMTYYIHSVKPTQPAYGGTKSKTRSYLEILSRYEPFILSSANRKILIDALRGGHKSVSSSIFDIS